MKNLPQNKYQYCLNTLCLIALWCLQVPSASGQSLRVEPYLLSPSAHSMRVNWFTTNAQSGVFKLVKEGSQDTVTYHSQPQFQSVLSYSALEEAERAEFPDMFENANYKHSLLLNNLEAESNYVYTLQQGDTSVTAHFTTPPPSGKTSAIRFITFADSETDPEGRTTYRKWATGNQDEKSTGRPDEKPTYLVTETQGFRENLKFIQQRNPDFLLLSGDIVQGGGYQRAWDEFFFHMAGKFDNLLSSIPLVPAIGNWENFGARNGGYDPASVALSRAKYQTYFDAPSNNHPAYQNYYYRIDYGPVTIITLDSSNGLPDSTDQDTNININAATYPGSDLPDINPGSLQWQWAEAELKDAYDQGQIIFVQFHHIPYSSGGHSLPLTAEGSSGQAGIPMRVYTPLFKKFGVVAVFCGHNESFEHSVIEGIHFYDAGVAGDGLRYSLANVDERFVNPYGQWVAHLDSPELWKGKQLLDGGKHYGHLEVNIQPSENGQYQITIDPVYIFPMNDEEGMVTGFERRIYQDQVEFTWPLESKTPNE